MYIIYIHANRNVRVARFKMKIIYLNNIYNVLMYLWQWIK